LSGETQGRRMMSTAESKTDFSSLSLKDLIEALLMTNRVTSDGQFSLPPEGGDDRLATLCASKFGSGISAEFGKVLRTEVGKLVVLPVSPEIFDRVKLRRVGRQKLQLDGTHLTVDKIAHQPTTMSL
jgi:hypothetical protein